MRSALVIILLFLNTLAPCVQKPRTHFTLPTFNKTHFIVGDTRKQTDPSNPALVYEYPSPLVLFSPDDMIRPKLIEFIEHEQLFIKIAAFSFTEPAITHALHAAHKRGITVELITDPTCLQLRSCKIGTLHDSGIAVYLYNPTYHIKNVPNYMHHKFIIFGKNSNDLPAVWTGSLNFTKSACERNQENIVVLWNPDVVQRFNQQFDLLKSRSKYFK